MGEDRSFRGQDVIDSVINTGSISNCTIIQLSSATQSSFGFQLYTLDYFKDHKSTEKDFEDWKNGFPFKIEAIKEEQELRRKRVIDEIEARLELKHSMLILGESGTSKSTVLKEIMCDYVDEKYLVLYNHGTEIQNSENMIKFLEGLLKGGNKVLVAIDDAHTVNSAPIFYVMDQLSCFQANQKLRFILSARLPDFDHFFESELGKVEDPVKQSIEKFIGDAKPIQSEFVYTIEPFNVEDIKDFIRKYGKPESIESIDQTSKQILEITNGMVIMVKFAVLGEGLANDVRDKYDRYLCANTDNQAEKIKTMLVCSLLRLSDFDVTDDLLEKMKLYKFALDLKNATLYHNFGQWDTIHRIWTLVFLNFMFDENDERRAYANKEYLWNAFDSVVMLEDEKATKAFIAALVPSQLEYSYVPLKVTPKRYYPPPKEVESKFRFYVEHPTCHLSSQIASILWDVIGNIIKEVPEYPHRLEKALDAFNKAIELDPTKIHYWVDKLYVLYELGLFDEALESINKAIKLEPNRATLWIIKAGVFEGSDRSKKFNEALESINEAIKLDPSNTDFWENKSEFLERWNRFDEALESYNELIKLQPNEEKHLFCKAHFLKRVGRLDEALESINKAIELKPNETYLWQSKASFLERLNRPEQALEAYNKLIELDSTERNISAWGGRGNALLRLGRFDEALGSYNKAIELNSKGANIEIWGGKGEALIQLGRPEEALETLNKALEYNPSEADYWGCRGYVLLLLVRFTEALESLNKAIELDPIQADYWYNRACVKARLKNTDAALEDLKKAIELNKDYIKLALEDKDFGALRNDEHFKALIDGLFPKVSLTESTTNKS